MTWNNKSCEVIERGEKVSLIKTDEGVIAVQTAELVEDKKKAKK